MDDEEQADDTCSDLSSTDDSSSDSSTEDQKQLNPDHHIPGPVWQSRKSKVVHRFGRVEGSTACGRLVRLKTFFFLEDGCSKIFACCGICFKGEVISTVNGMADALSCLEDKRKRQRTLQT